MKLKVMSKKKWQAIKTERVMNQRELATLRSKVQRLTLDTRILATALGNAINDNPENDPSTAHNNPTYIVSSDEMRDVGYKVRLGTEYDTYEVDLFSKALLPD